MKYVLVTTKHRGVFAGELAERELDKVTLHHARCAIKWSTTGGFLELAKDGPNRNSKIGSEAPVLELYDVTSIADCTEAAEKAWRAA